ncbi:protein rep [Limosilactobacillus reuteri]|uniref:Protein rep n=1 Tax=Limosilactobacillus reuteri TaxID=1598 RepID=A0A256SNW5_LIMRT|nr:protein rep [Limosilactobacillus reuteri]OYS67818.1 protein rep [Limosilactobacillus reuteri]
MYTGEILKDTSKYNGKERPWRIKKLDNLTYAEYLEVLKFKKANRVRDCGNVLKFAKTVDGMKLYQTWFCHSRLCPLCSWRRSLKNSYELQKILDEANRKVPKAIYLFLTLTEENSQIGDLKENLRSMNSSIRRLMQYKKVSKHLIGYVRSSEITVNRENYTFHQHMHILLMMKSSYFNSDSYLTNMDWAKLWKKARKLDYEPIINIQKIRAKSRHGQSALISSAKEVSKYQVKDSDYITNNKESDLIILDELEKSLQGSRQLSFGGLLKEIRHNLLFDKKEDDLINIGNDSDSSNIVKTVMFKWNSSISDYVSWE